MTLEIITYLLGKGRILHFLQHGPKGDVISEISDINVWTL